MASGQSLQYFKEYYQRNKEKKCAYQRKYQGEHTEKNNEKSKESQVRLRDEVLNIYGFGEPKCACCGESHYEFLTIDHINGNGSEHRRIVGSGIAFYRWLRKNNYPVGYRLLCMNCNFSLGKSGYCPHAKEV